MGRGWIAGKYDVPIIVINISSVNFDISPYDNRMAPIELAHKKIHSSFTSISRNFHVARAGSVVD
jgi:hypothetical protein